ncbi:alkaline phosphatase family protein [Nesterenkonia ebinurensis]|uniref:alkaline phosphatase family protein n=1 Tax=Nesterenkonia ebinurensis TaxID=2608252 RepID=UPI00123CCB52|nr:nucleotide pyrophosphatase/phosphodiesterase family protein [Nesterenkonia ebinurensis]
MIPAPDYAGANLRHVLTSAAAGLGLSGFQNRLGVPEASITVVILADGLGEKNLAAHTGHARFLASAWRSSNTAKVLDCGAPATTACSLTSLGTGLPPGQHGLLGYDLYAPHLGRVVNQLGSWPKDLDPAAWQPHPTVLQQAVDAGAQVATVSRTEFRSSPLTRAALQHSGDFLGATGLEARFAAAADWIGQNRRAIGIRQGPPAPLLVYLYVDEIDDAGHEFGVDSPQWRGHLEDLDAAARRFSQQLTARYGEQASILLTADHGMVDVAEPDRIDISERAELLDGVAHTAGDPRMIYLHVEPGQDAEKLASRWRAEFGDSAWVLTRSAAVDDGWFGAAQHGGEVEDRVLDRIGDVIIAVHAPIGIYHIARTGKHFLKMVGLHGSITDTERQVPLLELTGRSFS